MKPRLPAWYRLLLDRMTRANSAFIDFDDLVNSNPRYRPTIHHDYRPELRCWAVEYDRYQRKRGDLRRVYPPLDHDEAFEIAMFHVEEMTDQLARAHRMLTAVEKRRRRYLRCRV